MSILNLGHVGNTPVARGKKVKALADQLTTVSKKPLINHAGTVSNIELNGIKQAISIQLDLRGRIGQS
jgi:mRNA-degrading endonuclease toxin of MazEF toxin-antitoxin module